MLTEEIKNKIRELRILYPNVGIGYGHKVTNEEMTGEFAIVFSVKEKKAKHLLSPDELLPSEDIILSSTILKTDVVEVGEIKPLACNPECYTFDSTNPPGNRNFIRPIVGGLKIMPDASEPYYGTMGFIAVDIETDSLVGVTNNHVAIKDATFTTERNINGVIFNEYDITDGGPVTPDFMGQPTSFSVGNNIGQVLRYVPIVMETGGTINTVDAAIFSISGSSVMQLSESYKQFGLTGITTPLPFATTAEIDNLLVTNPLIYSSGARTGPKQGQPCPLRIFQLNTNIPLIYYNIQNSEQLTSFVDVFSFVRPVNDPNISTVCNIPSYPGDSGSAMIAQIGGVFKIIGLLFAGSDYYGYACRIDEVVQQLGIYAWDGSLKNLVDTSTIQYRTIPGGNGNKTVTCGGNTYWQVGLTTLNNPCV
jgi:hypothetical protein